MTDELPPVRFLDAAANCIGQNCWADAEAVDVSETLASIIAHARTLQQLAKYERPPVDEAELQRRQDAREASAVRAEQSGFAEYAECARKCAYDQISDIQSAYVALCHRDNVTPTAVEEWGQ